MKETKILQCMLHGLALFLALLILTLNSSIPMLPLTVRKVNEKEIQEEVLANLSKQCPVMNT